MFRVALVLIACTALLSACSSYSSPVAAPTQPSGQPVFITLQVQQHLNKYYHTIGGGRSGAFAVSPKGTVGFFAYCQVGQCNDRGAVTQKALSGCEARAGGDCILLAVGRSVRHSYMTYQEAEAKGLLKTN